ncbi:hypothetical protein AB0Q95_04925 [Streptomyces sp. NPDC059900]|uniref:hypothetical protein n=1 Tax=Streptomyces sp. NPDC059900 TaxID=3155816 RepID=UPI003428FBC8
MVSVAVFTTNNAAGRELFAGCRDLVRQLYGPSARVFDHSDSGAGGFVTRSLVSDLVIFDGTPDGRDEHRYDIVQSASFIVSSFVDTRVFRRGRNRSFRVGGAG